MEFPIKPNKPIGSPHEIPTGMSSHCRDLVHPWEDLHNSSHASLGDATAAQHLATEIFLEILESI